jgi:hypothetical protein
MFIQPLVSMASSEGGSLHPLNHVTKSDEDPGNYDEGWGVWSPSGHHLIWGSRTRGTGRAPVISGTVGVWAQQGGASQG